MPATLEQPASESATPRSVFILRFVSTVVLWSIALLIAFSGYEVFFWLLISAFGLIALFEFYRMLDHAHLPNFKIIGLICGAIMLAGSFHYFSTIGPAGSYDFEVALLFFFLLTMFARQMFARLRHDEPLQTMAYTVLGLLLGFAAVIGDLAESIIKRSTGVKDSGNLLPGIGGALDLIDSLLFTAPLLFFYLRLVIRVS